MPVELLTDEQVAAYGRFEGPLTRAQLERSFFLNGADRELVDQRQCDPNRLGFGVQLGTVRFLGAFLANPTDVPPEVAGWLVSAIPQDREEPRLGISSIPAIARRGDRRGIFAPPVDEIGLAASGTGLLASRLESGGQPRQAARQPGLARGEQPRAALADYSTAPALAR
jgi:hypothetical protein